MTNPTTRHLWRTDVDGNSISREECVESAARGLANIPMDDDLRDALLHRAGRMYDEANGATRELVQAPRRRYHAWICRG